MSNTSRNALAILGGVVAGSVVNMGLVKLGHALIPPPEGGMLGGRFAGAGEQRSS